MARRLSVSNETVQGEFWHFLAELILGKSKVQTKQPEIKDARCAKLLNLNRAGVAELADALDSKSNGA